MQRILILAITLLLPSLSSAASTDLFGYREIPQQDISMFSQWVSVLERHLTEDLPEADCTDTRFNQCHLRAWQSFIDSIRELPVEQQLQAVNRYANRKSYVLDLDNYGVEDYWAVAREFLYNGGDCEDYAITKLFSLRWLGIPMERLRIVILQDTNLRIPHAILAYYAGDRILLLDNQIDEVVDHHQVVHYVPVYSINENGWWLHTPS
jgi:predicted transglutaminase-like cysteine proteinase